MFIFCSYYCYGSFPYKMQRDCRILYEQMETTTDNDNPLVRHFDLNKLTNYYPSDKMILLLCATRSSDADRLQRGIKIILDTLKVSEKREKKNKINELYYN